jgi:hypothetical protein
LTPADIKSFEDLERYLAAFANFHGDPMPYDFVGAFALFVAMLDNLAANHVDADLEGLAETGPPLTDGQRAFLLKLLAIAE